MQHYSRVHWIIKGSYSKKKKKVLLGTISEHKIYVVVFYTEHFKGFNSNTIKHFKWNILSSNALKTWVSVWNKLKIIARLGTRYVLQREKKKSVL